MLIYDALNTYFTLIASELASKIYSSNIDATAYIHPADKVFGFYNVKTMY